jgi:hypothetical protein
MRYFNIIGKMVQLLNSYNLIRDNEKNKKMDLKAIFSLLGPFLKTIFCKLGHQNTVHMARSNRLSHKIF